MTQDHSSKLSFSIEESVWLNKGQEVDEIVSLSLDPEITVEENGEYVLIRGGLKLTGEYRSNGESNSSQGKSTPLSDQVAYRSIEEVTLNEDGTGEIKHYFPIDVTIPQERITSLDEIFVLIESFDYDLPERGCIQLTADVAITGMSSGKVSREEEVIDQETTLQMEERSFHFEAYQQADPVEDEVVVPFPRNEVQDEEAEEEDVVESRVENQIESSVTEEQIMDEKDRVEPVAQVEEIEVEEIEVEEIEEAAEKPKTPSIAFGVIKERPKQVTTSDNSEELSEENGPTIHTLKSLAENRKEIENVKGNTEVEVKEVSLVDEKEVEVEPPREENALYLTKMLTKGEEKEFKKLKICIVQNNETLDLIAARYEVNQSSLIKINRLNDASIEEGQILYIPVTK